MNNLFLNLVKDILIKTEIETLKEVSKPYVRNELFRIFAQSGFVFLLPIVICAELMLITSAIYYYVNSTDYVLYIILSLILAVFALAIYLKVKNYIKRRYRIKKSVSSLKTIPQIFLDTWLTEISKEQEQMKT